VGRCGSWLLLADFCGVGGLQPRVARSKGTCKLSSGFADGAGWRTNAGFDSEWISPSCRASSQPARSHRSSVAGSQIWVQGAY
jgi:hypothetical protein